mgnify:CR=1 FL=1
MVSGEYERRAMVGDSQSVDQSLLTWLFELVSSLRTATWVKKVNGVVSFDVFSGIQLIWNLSQRSKAWWSVRVIEPMEWRMRCLIIVCRSWKVLAWLVLSIWFQNDLPLVFTAIISLLHRVWRCCGKWINMTRIDSGFEKTVRMKVPKVVELGSWYAWDAVCTSCYYYIP